VKATAFAPATVANVGPGFDILGFAVEGKGDTVTVETSATPGIRLKIDGPGSEVIPLEPEGNTATAGLLALLAEIDYPGGLDVHIQKGIPIGSGLGGSASSAVGGIVAANAALQTNLSQSEMLGYALIGEAVASGDAHPDNAAPCLYGGFTFAKLMHKTTGRLGPEDLCIRMIPVPEDLEVVLINPAVRVDTKAAREVLPDSFERGLVVAQTANLARLLCAAYENDRESFGDACSDLLIEPYRKTLIPIFEKVRKTCIMAGTLAFNISGSGPTMFVIVRKGDGARVVAAVLNAYKSEPYPVEAWVSQIGVQGARILP